MLALIREHGFHGTAMSQVARKAGVAAGTIYHYFESKDELIRELFHYNVDRVQELIDESLNLENMGFKERFEHLIYSLYRFYIRHPNVLLFFEQFINSPYQTDKSGTYKSTTLFRFIEAGVEEGHIKNVKPEILIVIILGNVATLAKLGYYSKAKLQESDLAQAIEIYWNGIAAK